MSDRPSPPDDAPRPSNDASPPADRDEQPTRSAPAPAPSILDHVSRRTGRSARVHLHDEGSEGAASPLIGDPAARSGLPSGRGNYQVMGEIARGGMGAIFRSHDTDLGRDVAMKVLLEEHADSDALLERFVEEAQIGGQLQHPGIVPVYELGLMADERPYFTMKLVKGRTLAKLLAARKDAHDGRRGFLGIFEKVCETLAYAHARNVIHRDLKPANIMVGAFGEVQVVDWGLAKVLHEGGVADERREEEPRTQVSIIETVRSGSSATGSQSLAGSILGTPAYMPPEQAQGRIDQVDERADVFGLGAILCEILTGAPPYAGRHDKVVVEATKALQDDAFERLAACGADAELVELVTDCINPARVARPADAAAVLERVQACLARQEQRAREADAAVHRAQQERKARVLTLALAATVLVAVVAGGLGYLGVAEAEAERRQETTRQVDDLLEEAGVARERGDFASALDACARADVALAAGDADTELSARIARARERAEAGAEGLRLERERAARVDAFVSELEDIVYGSGSAWSGVIADRVRAGRLVAAFADFGLDPLADLDAAVAAIEATGQVTPIAFAIDEWSRLTRNSRRWRDPDALRLSELAGRLDDDPVRARIRTAIDHDDGNALRGLVGEAAGADWPPTTVAMLYFALKGVGLHSRAEPILRDCQRSHPTNAGVSQLLARFLLDQPDPDLEEALRFATAAQAAREDNAVLTQQVSRVLREMGRLDDALETQLAAIRAHPDDEWLAGGFSLRSLLGAYESDARRREVRRLVHEAFVAAAPQTAGRRHSAAWFLVGSSEPAARDPELALELLEPVMDELVADPEEAPDAWHTLGVTQHLLGRDADAIRSMEACMRLPAAADGSEALVVALSLARLGEQEEARVWYGQALRLRTPPDQRSEFFGDLEFLWDEAAERFRGDG